ncbi:unnamed protein product (macronuclear) [Paramecium tetraurelia]|uniref:Transmembrane protein n=1 Tax=Paramecium tetraurelia TaxID=5888 RepID=A0E859_PARTE|nr:uncharacterized protein GSPATT00024204001 [Paramecium tetraurelia]CAK91476.1 unnamed protein product [Paramecium tetraurelia]|eukprot:XP_001458873.1 hypothetical protein (macronuclear) [Paramecium tetraurelia strain d4-2]
MIEQFLFALILSLRVTCNQYEFKIEIGQLKAVLELNNATNVTLTDESNKEFCWIEDEKVLLQTTSLMNYQDLDIMNKYYFLLATQSGLWVLMNDMILTQITHDGTIINQKKIQGNYSQFKGFYDEKSEDPIFLVDYQLLNDTQITFYHGAIKTYDGFLFVINKFIYVYDLQNNTNKYFGSIDISKFQNIIEYDIKKIDDFKYYLYLMDQHFGLNVLKLLFRQNNINSKIIYSEANPLQNPKSFFCNEYYSCFGLYYNNVYKILNFRINFLDNSIQIREILEEENKIIKIINVGEMMFIQSKNNHKVYLYNSNQIQNIQIMGLQQISVVNSSLIYIITNTKLIKLQLSRTHPKILCFCDDNEDCPLIYDYGINFRDKTKMMYLKFTIEFQTSIEDQMNQVLAILFSIISFFGIILLIFWIYSLKTQILLLEGKIQQGYQFMQKNKLPIFHTLENLAFTFRGGETMSKRIQQQESQEIQEIF